MISRTSFLVSFFDVDLMGIVHHTVYPKWFQTGRRDFLVKAGIPHSKFNSLGLYLPLSHLECKYKSPARFGYEISVTTCITFVSCVKIMFEYKVQNNIDGKLLATGTTVHGWTDINVNPINIEKNAPDIYSLLQTLVVDKNKINI
ncbi:acyl-CoA thioesterase [Ruminiclostridium herbifermentans]|uniref:Acyl-CoA thioesterase n=1 Tax=Ruminiclostridium herbifermentans TaxID=2488810 RepID=A0A4U7JDZ1_9FIRM|nr:acyl-CoA thioesterase [Ruminiclostridium herbifermentans]QNU67968.1 acyl-CoA thioesterase [Ruminiclostridium herbifermentans]